MSPTSTIADVLSLILLSNELFCKKVQISKQVKWVHFYSEVIFGGTAMGQVCIKEVPVAEYFSTFNCLCMVLMRA